MKVSVSFLKSNCSQEETIKKINQTSCDYLHVDLTDGIFAGEKNYDILLMKELLKQNQKPLDIHFMIENPNEELSAFLDLNVSFYTLPIEIPNILEKINFLKQNQKKVGLAISPDTKIEEIKKYINQIDLVLLMSVYPGFGGQKFLEKTSTRLKDLIKIRKETNASFLIEVDGGINKETIQYVKEADIVVSGSYVCCNDNYENQVKSLKE